MKTDNSISLISRIREKAYSYIITELKKAGIDGIVPSHGGIILTLHHLGELTKTKIALKINRKPSTVTTLVNKLLNFGYLKTRKNEKDSRSTVISLTKKGQSIIPHFMEISQKMYDIEYKGFSTAEKALFLKLTKRISKNFEELDL